VKGESNMSAEHAEIRTIERWVKTYSVEIVDGAFCILALLSVFLMGYLFRAFFYGLETDEVRGAIREGVLFILIAIIWFRLFLLKQLSLLLNAGKEESTYGNGSAVFLLVTHAVILITLVGSGVCILIQSIPLY
jgi:hypothetical protein